MRKVAALRQREAGGGFLGFASNSSPMHVADASSQAMLRRVPTSSRYEHSKTTSGPPVVIPYAPRTSSNDVRHDVLSAIP